MSHKKASTQKPKRPGPAPLTSKNPPLPPTEVDSKIYKISAPKRHRGPFTGRAVPGTGAKRQPNR